MHGDVPPASLNRRRLLVSTQCGSMIISTLIQALRTILRSESFVSLTALASVTHTVGLGHMVLSAGYRNPALVAKMASTLDVVSDGRMMVGIGAGWKRDEWLGYGYGYPTTRERLEILADALEILTRLLGRWPSLIRGASDRARTMRTTFPEGSSHHGCLSRSEGMDPR